MHGWRIGCKSLKRLEAKTSGMVPNADGAVRWGANSLDWDAKVVNNGSMKTTVDIPDSVLDDAMKFTKARTKREAIVTAMEEYNRRRRMAALIKHAGTCDGFPSADALGFP